MLSFGWEGALPEVRKESSRGEIKFKPACKLEAVASWKHVHLTHYEAYVYNLLLHVHCEDPFLLIGNQAREFQSKRQYCRTHRNNW